MDWDYQDRVCGNCRYWPAKRETYGVYGIGGPHTDGSVSDCRRHPPIAIRQDVSVCANARWPTTGRGDWCGDFEYAGEVYDLVGTKPQRTDKDRDEA